MLPETICSQLGPSNTPAHVWQLASEYKLAVSAPPPSHVMICDAPGLPPGRQVSKVNGIATKYFAVPVHVEPL